MYETKRPKEGPWIVPPSEARGQYIHTQNGPSPMVEEFPIKSLRPDQVIWMRYNPMN